MVDFAIYTRQSLLSSVDVESANSIALRSFPDNVHARQTIDFTVKCFVKTSTPLTEI